MVADRTAPGFTLVELLVAVAVSVIALGLIVQLAGPAAAAFQALPEALDAQQRLRAASSLLATEIAGAGAGPSLAWGAGASLTWPGILPCRWTGGPLSGVAGGCAQSDAITVLSVAQQAPQAIVPAAIDDLGAAIPLARASACELAVAACRMTRGSRALVIDGSGAWDVLVVTDVAADGTAIGHAQARLSHPYSASVLSLEYVGDAAVPVVLIGASAEDRRTTYGPLPPPVGVGDPRRAWPPGENCMFAMAGTQQASRLAPLVDDGTGTATLPFSMLTDGPWCPDPGSPNRYDADLLRIRRVRVTLRVHAQATSVRGSSAALFSLPGQASDAVRMVPDLVVRFDVAPRNLAR
ncbi:MAG: prepilin-type N-terminal cleavage/methylation domain-containing protein [Acidobacteria bacterium]|nr:prepilin-type N-terminal cleavage/methylation domain-containing protein [Acidobacteriota bacterium]